MENKPKDKYPIVKKPKGQLGDKAKRPKPGIPITKEIILELIAKHDGNLSRVADALGTTRHLIRRKCDADAELDQALVSARERLIDELEESCFRDAITHKDTGLRCFMLKTQGRHRGYEQEDVKNQAHVIATAAFDFIVNKSKNPAELTHKSKSDKSALE
jgi:hypothetical protein